jgi:xanthine dehydrogenase iron-sulfur cluster and FAD-binding subunit A
VHADGSSITTVEGLQGTDGSMHPLQEAFVEHHGLQCGFCTPGMLMSGLYLLDTEPDADRERIREELSGNICRCAGYQGTEDAGRRRGDVPVFRRGVQLRWSDQDVFGHVNNARIVTVIEEARAILLFEVAVVDPVTHRPRRLTVEEREFLRRWTAG